MEQIGRYSVQRELGRGGMATVYLARDPTVDRQVAIKVLPSQFMHDVDFRQRFEREARTIARLEHGAIVPVYDFGEQDGQPYIVMRYLDGGTLADRIKDGPLPLAEASRILSRVATALDEAHERGIVHRDLKPANILFDRQGEPYLSDFGIVKLAEASAVLTGTGVVGTPTYMSPEQAYGDRSIDGRADVYALGVILFEMLTGKTPFEADTPMGIAMKHILEPVPPVREIKPDLPEAATAVMLRALAKKPDHRFATAGAFADAFAMVVRGETPELPPQPAFEPPDTEELPAAAPRPLETLSSPESPAPVTHDSHPTGEQPPVVVRKGVPLWVVIMLVAGGLLTTLCVGIFAFGRGVNFTRQVAGLVGMGPSEETITTTNEELLQGAEALDVDMNLRFSTTVIEAFDEEDVAFTSEYTRPVTLDDLTITYDVEEGLGTLTVRQPERLEDSGFTLGDVLTRFELQLAENLPVNLRVNAGTGSLTLDLRDMIVYELDVTGGVGVTEIRLPENGTMDITLTASFGEFNVRAPDSIGDLAINSFRVLGGGSSTRIQIPPVGGYEVDVQTGVGQVIVELPEDIAARVEIDSAMSDIAIRDPRLLDVGENVWQTEDYEPGSSSAVLIRVQAGVGSVEISDY